MTSNREIYREFRHEMEDLSSNELGELSDWLHQDIGFAIEAGPEFTRAVYSTERLRHTDAA